MAHVGDSRCYRLRAGILEALTVDHSLLVDVLEAHPEADDALLARTPQHAVTRALGMEETLRVSVRTLKALAGDVYLMCSDGLTDALDDERIEALLSESRTPEEHVQALLHAALGAGAQDNVAAVVVACRDADAPPRRRTSMRPPALPPPLPAASASGAVRVGAGDHHRRRGDARRTQ